MRWLWFDYVDPELELSREERRTLVKLRGPRFRATPARRAAELVTLLLITSLIILAILILRSRLGLSATGGTAVLAGIAVSVWLITAVTARWYFGPATREALREMGYDVCIACGYWLRGLDPRETRCPECGAERTTHDPTTAAISERPGTAR